MTIILEPHEQACPLCKSPNLSLKCVTERAKLMTRNTIHKSVKVFVKVCKNCSLEIPYKEYEENIRTFNNKFMLSLELCVWMRLQLQEHTAIGRVANGLENDFKLHEIPTEKQELPKKELLGAYFLFEALSDYSDCSHCDDCSHYPPLSLWKVCLIRKRMIVMDLLILKSFGRSIYSDAIEREMVKGDSKIKTISQLLGTMDRRTFKNEQRSTKYRI